MSNSPRNKPNGGDNSPRGKASAPQEGQHHGLGTLNYLRKQGKDGTSKSEQALALEKQKEEAYAEVDRRAKKRVTDRVLLYNRLERSDTGANLVNFLLYLWAPDDDGNSCPYVMMRDTLIIVNGLPRHWLFLDKEGKLKKRNSVRLKDKKEILNIFCKGHGKGSKVQAAVHIVPPAYDKACIMENPTEQDGRAMPSIQQLDGSELKAMILANTMPDGLLQSFSLPFGDPTSLITCTWYPNFFYHDRQIINKRRRFQERGQVGPGGVVEEKEGGEEIDSVHSTGEHHTCLLSGRLHTICNAIARHVTKVSPQKYQIGSMRLHFKQDMEGRLWLLFCSSLELMHNNSMHKQVRSASDHRAHKKAQKERESAAADEDIPQNKSYVSQEDSLAGSPFRSPSVGAERMPAGTAFQAPAPAAGPGAHSASSLSMGAQLPPLKKFSISHTDPKVTATREFHAILEGMDQRDRMAQISQVAAGLDLHLDPMASMYYAPPQRPKRPPATYHAPTILPSDVYSRSTTPRGRGPQPINFSSATSIPMPSLNKSHSSNPHLIKPSKDNRSPSKQLWSSKLQNW